MSRNAFFSFLPTLLAASILGAATAGARTVAYWPLTLPAGTTATTQTAFEDIGPEHLTAYPVSLDNRAKIVEGESAHPVIVTNGFPVGYGVYDPVDGINRDASTAPRFSASYQPMACLRVQNPAALRLKTFTVECFFRMNPNAPANSWHCLAVMPGQLWEDGKQVANCDSWGLRITDTANNFKVRFTGSDYTLSYRSDKADYIASATKTRDQNYGSRAGIYDHQWHHVAFSVNDDTKKIVFYYDYTPAASISLNESVWYGENEDLFIGATPQTTGAGDCSIAHFRISDEVLTADQMLRFTRTAPAADEDPDALLHLDFEPVDGISDNNVFFNDAATGSAVFRTTRAFSTSKAPYPLAHKDSPSANVYTSLANAIGRSNNHSMSNAYVDAIKSAVYWQPASDVFADSSFTMECCYKTEEASQWKPVIRRIGGIGNNTVQFNLGFGDYAARVAVKVFSGADGTTTYVVNDPATTADGQWHHVAAVFNRPLKKMYLYRDYQLVGSTTYPGNLWPTNGAPVYIGKTPSKAGGWDGLTGCIDNVRITKRALSVGEFLVPVTGRPSAAGKTLAWATFDSSLDAPESSFLLTNGVATAESGAAPALHPFGDGAKTKVEDGAGTLLRQGDMAYLAFAGGSLAYPTNAILPACHDKTVEFLVRGGEQQAGAGLVQCSLYDNNDNTLAWGVYFDSTGRGLHVRCATLGADTWSATAIDEDTSVVVADGSWHHIALTMSESVVEGTARTTVSIRKDYEAQPSWTKTVDGRVFYDTGRAKVILGKSTVTSKSFTGSINELRISDGVLAANELLHSNPPLGVVVFLR